MRLLLIFFLSISFNVNANMKLSGQWEGFDLYASSYNSHMLEIDENGKGFYALSLSGGLNEGHVFPIHLDELVYTDGYHKLVKKHASGMVVTVLLAEQNQSQLGVITIIRDANDVLIMSLSWQLSRTRSRLQNERLYNFAKKLGNK